MDKEIKLNWGIPISWLDVKLDDIAIIIQGQSPPSSTYNNEQIGLPFFQGKAEFTDLHPVVKVWCKAPTKIAEPNDILLSVRAPVGSTNLANVKCGIGRGLSAIRYQYAHKFVFYYLRLIERELDKRGTGTTFKAISGDVVRNTHIPLPPLNEQNRIVDKLDELLSELEKGKEQLQTSLEQLKVYRQSILKHAFEGKLSEEWRKKQKKLKTPDELVAEIIAYRKQQYEKQLKEYKAGKIKVKPKEPKNISLPTNAELADKPELPKGWFYIFLKDISEVVERVNSKEKKATESFLYLDIGGINNEKNIIESHKEYKWKDAPSRAQQIVKINDILFSTVRTYMKNIAMVDDEKFSNQIASSGFTVVRALKGIINANFLFKQLLSDAFIQPLNDLQTGSSYPAVRDTDVFNQIVPICSIEEQIFVTQELDEKYSIVQNLEETINQNLIQSESLRQTLLRKAFEGKLVGQDPTDEPASVLLERIKKEREEYLKAEKERKKTEKPLYIKSRKMAEELKRIIEILKESKEPVSAKTLWQSSTHKDDIDDFYSALKKHIESGEVIEMPRKGKESFLKLVDSK